MTAQTASSLSNILKETWNEELLRAQFDMKRNVERQFLYGNHMNPQYGIKYQFFPVTIAPNAVAAQRRRVALLEQEVARAKRRGKPSYRQRQANARKTKAARGS